MGSQPVISARLDPALRAEIGEPEPLRYAEAPAREADIPPHVRSASALRRWGRHLAIVQDDVLALAMLAQEGTIGPLLLPAENGGRTFDATRGNKEAKPDLEAAIVLPDGRLVALGSGSSAVRERVFVVSPDGGARVIPASDWYERLRAEAAFRGTGLNIEGAVIDGARLLLFQRANGPSRANSPAINAVGELSLDSFVAWLDGNGVAPALLAIRRYELGAVAGVLVGFTDACAMTDGRIAFLACAENSADAVTDGPIVASRFGILDGEDARMTDIIGPDGRPAMLKLEGIEPRRGESLSFDVVADVDDPGAAGLLAALRAWEG